MKRFSFRLVLALVGAGVLGVASGKPLPASKQSPAQSIIDELNLIPRPGLFGFKMEFPAFTAAAVGPYRADYVSLAELKSLLKKDPSKYPLRSAVLKAIGTLQESTRWRVDTSFIAPLGPAASAAVLKEQKHLGANLFALERALEELEATGMDRDKEPSRRWQAHYDYVRTALKARLVFGYEYTYLLGQVRRDAMPDLAPGHAGWRLVPRKSLQITEPKMRKWDREVDAAWKRLEREHPRTPWETFAQRERISHRGLEWLPCWESEKR
jgi:hypothetical protein